MSVKELKPGIWNLAAEGDFSTFLVLGTERALLIDSGWGCDDLFERIAGITDLPITLVNTHGHIDHVGANNKFSEFYMHPCDIPIMCANNKNAKPVNEGDKFDLGGRVLEVFHIPGHSPGSIGLLDRANRLMFTGDMLANKPIYFIPDQSNADEYIASMEKLEKLMPEIDVIICSHGQNLMEPSIIAKFKAAMQGYKDGTLKPELERRGSGNRIKEVELYLTEEGLGFVYPLNYTGMEKIED